ncbi:uncharacterized protein N7511_006922 [Penicillium nucicola]|uniref:uncharacterized protein n=1 Tax=Penicillium nucicola TaxID=1850975 RepID=UPI0025454AD9|nr:uncharacterized protein N7511_006922 [Penicillium nucicola]KAJ5758228.1 hypothetical protein N7511_006922 [Penicillium nucicola]
MPQALQYRHVNRSQAEKGWDIVHYPCFGMFWFLHFDLAGSPIYDEIVAKVKEGALLLDLGCALGQDIRRLVYDGAPQEHLIGLDLRQEFIDLGFELFQDRTSLHSTFVAQDFLDDAQSLEPWAGNLKIINSGYFMHLWGWEGQLNVAKRIVSLLSLQGGSIVTGVHFGSEETGHTTKVPENVDPLFLHDCDTLKRLWEQVGRETQTRVSVWMATERDEDYLRLDPKAFRLRWYVRLWRD